MMAVRGRHEATVRLLLEHGADVNARNETGATALSWATERGFTEIVALLRKAGAGA